MDMDGLSGLIAFVVGWLAAQMGKILGDLIRNGGRMSLRELADCFVRSGGMPSGHTASFTALTACLGIQYGFLSGISVLALCMTVIVVYDSVNVRYAVGEQGKLLNTIAVDRNYKREKLKVVEGHTVPQAIVGAILGVLIGVAIGFAF